MPNTETIAVVRGEAEIHPRIAHLFTTAKTEISCAANDLHTWGIRTGSVQGPQSLAPRIAEGLVVRKLYRSGILLDPLCARYANAVQSAGGDVRITPDELNETIVIDGRIAILAGDLSHGVRSYSVVTVPEVVQGVSSLYAAAWRSATPLSTWDRRVAELREMAPRILEVLASGCKDETAARTLGLSVRTYRRRVAELMAALGAGSRFQAGVKARELGLI
ncbi:response regulator transcription factor [Labedaea rhizosphaerae]|uniref:HTH luxR-type domain-containing protein n=1 Tax=Labedaea rhizosphaerae TaxID=598644 RepID=A0A4R6SN94_LABRH|nr:response regulator transcription factor [Labedaea rhizosphaerae]TDQ05579.1 hypothetical protein EV186_1011553 [Labedaea rhizosphaerae]